MTWTLLLLIIIVLVFHIIFVRVVFLFAFARRFILIKHDWNIFSFTWCGVLLLLVILYSIHTFWFKTFTLGFTFNLLRILSRGFFTLTNILFRVKFRFWFIGFFLGIAYPPLGSLSFARAWRSIISSTNLNLFRKFTVAIITFESFNKFLWAIGFILNHIVHRYSIHVRVSFDKRLSELNFNLLLRNSTWNTILSHFIQVFLRSLFRISL